jgi:hypothetical protein
MVLFVDYLDPMVVHLRSWGCCTRKAAVKADESSGLQVVGLRP